MNLLRKPASEQHDIGSEQYRPLPNHKIPKSRASYGVRAPASCRAGTSLRKVSTCLPAGKSTESPQGSSLRRTPSTSIHGTGFARTAIARLRLAYAISVRPSEDTADRI